MVAELRMRTLGIAAEDWRRRFIRPATTACAVSRAMVVLGTFSGTAMQLKTMETGEEIQDVRVSRSETWPEKTLTLGYDLLLG